MSRFGPKVARDSAMDREKSPRSGGLVRSSRSSPASPAPVEAVGSRRPPLACGATVENAARTAGISARTAQRRLAEPAFRKRLQDFRTDMAQRTGSMLTAAGMEAVKTLIHSSTSRRPSCEKKTEVTAMPQSSGFRDFWPKQTSSTLRRYGLRFGLTAQVTIRRSQGRPRTQLRRSHRSLRQGRRVRQ
jgi:hypothetical protein